MILFILVFVLVDKLIDEIGMVNITTSLWNMYVTVLGDSDCKNEQRLRVELKAVYKERAGISAQDQYAKWTKLTRKYDKLRSELDTAEKAVSSKKSWFQGTYIAALVAVKWGLYYFLKIWYYKTELIQLPPDLFPGPVQWWLSMPFMSKGILSAGCWFVIVAQVFGSWTSMYHQLRDPAEIDVVDEAAPAAASAAAPAAAAEKKKQ